MCDGGSRLLALVFCCVDCPLWVYAVDVVGDVGIVVALGGDWQR